MHPLFLSPATSSVPFEKKARLSELLRSTAKTRQLMSVCFWTEHPVLKISKLDTYFSICGLMLRIVGATVKYMFFFKYIGGLHLKLDKEQVLINFLISWYFV